MRRGQSAFASEWNLLGAHAQSLEALAAQGLSRAPMGGGPGDPGASEGPGAGLTARRTLAGYEGLESSVPSHVPVRPENRV